jgi:predicted RNA-binding Zn-ribbon protein involved in translation (DUF1610 family)
MAYLKGKTVFATEEEISAGNMGMCVNCGNEVYSVEPDARGYTCESCGKKEVFGLEELLLMGGLELVEDEDEEYDEDE